MLDISEWVVNPVSTTENGVWALPDEDGFAYSDGAGPEAYVFSVVEEAQDLTTDSVELERSIIDWASEYHLSRKRSQLLKHFDFDSNGDVLEVGCGCGAITRFLGENFSTVVSIEGSANRARIARSRTRDLDNVQIVNAPFQEILFKKKFDIIFCIGVFEYSQMFVSGDSPYQKILSLFNDYLTENGVLILAIENQFGLKYFQGGKEDHTAVPYDGIEGYKRYTSKARTFGYHELKSLIGRSFSDVRFFFPYPDYKMPEGVVSEEFLRVSGVSELLGGYTARDYPGGAVRRFSERLALKELERNNQLHFFANSFIVAAAKQSLNSEYFPQLGVHYSSSRKPEFQTVTRFVRSDSNQVSAIKERVSPVGGKSSRSVHHEESCSEWYESESIGAEVLGRSLDTGLSFEDVFAPARDWLEFLDQQGESVNGVTWLPGSVIDCVWTNCYRRDEAVVAIDQEWVWPEKIPLKVLLIRAAYLAICEIQQIEGIRSDLAVSSRRRLISDIGAALGIELSRYDFDRFIELESSFMEGVFGTPHKRFKRRLCLSLRSKRILALATGIRNRLRTLHRKVFYRLLLFRRAAAR